MPPRRLEDVFKICLQDVFKTCLQDVLREVLKTSSRRLQDFFTGRLQDVLEDVKFLHWRRLQDMSWRLEDQQMFAGCNSIVLCFVIFAAQSSFSICSPISFNVGNKDNQSSILSGVWMLNFKFKWMSFLGLSLNFVGEYTL